MSNLAIQTSVSPRRLSRPQFSVADEVKASHGDIRDIARNVYCILGVPIDALSMSDVLDRIHVAVADRAPFLISTPNLDFLVQSRSDSEFKDTLLESDLCSADGMYVIWIGRLIGLPFRHKISGSDVLEALRSGHGARRLRAFLFGGKDDVAAKAANVLNTETGGRLSCVGSLNPGFGTVEELSRDEIINKVNASGADFLVVSLGAKKGQFWLHRNHQRIAVPVRAHFGAALNFTAGTLRRAPYFFQSWGLEWLWRIKEEPYLWRRYAHDASVLLRLLVTRLLPLAILARWYKLKEARNPRELTLSTVSKEENTTIALYGDATEQNIGPAIARFWAHLATENSHLTIDLSKTRMMDGRFLGLLLMVRKNLKLQGREMQIIGASSAMRKVFWLNDLSPLINPAKMA